MNCETSIHEKMSNVKINGSAPDVKSTNQIAEALQFGDPLYIKWSPNFWYRQKICILLQLHTFVIQTLKCSRWYISAIQSNFCRWSAPKPRPFILHQKIIKEKKLILLCSALSSHYSVWNDMQKTADQSYFRVHHDWSISRRHTLKKSKKRKTSIHLVSNDFEVDEKGSQSPRFAAALQFGDPLYINWSPNF